MPTKAQIEAPTFKKPSIAADIVAFTVVNDDDFAEGIWDGWQEQNPEARGPAPSRKGIYILCIGRKRDPYPQSEGYFCLPGGFNDYGEAPKDAAIRELGEETNLFDQDNPEEFRAWDGRMRFVGLWGEPDRDPRGHVMSHAWSVHLRTDEALKAFGGDDAKWCQWVHLDDIKDGTAPMGFDHQDIVLAAMGLN
jgi:8-oxo-dGTP diphosphatase